MTDYNEMLWQCSDSARIKWPAGAKVDPVSFPYACLEAKSRDCPPDELMPCRRTGFRCREGKGDRSNLLEWPATNLRSVPGFAQIGPVLFSLPDRFGDSGAIGVLATRERILTAG